jgi:hypothetical protein
MKRVEGYLAKAITADVARLTLTDDRKVALCEVVVGV